MKKQKTIYDELVTLLGFRADAEALDRVSKKLKDLDRKVSGRRGRRIGGTP